MHTIDGFIPSFFQYVPSEYMFSFLAFLPLRARLVVDLFERLGVVSGLLLALSLDRPRVSGVLDKWDLAARGSVFDGVLWLPGALVLSGVCAVPPGDLAAGGFLFDGVLWLPGDLDPSFVAVSEERPGDLAAGGFLFEGVLWLPGNLGTSCKAWASVSLSFTGVPKSFLGLGPSQGVTCPGGISGDRLSSNGFCASSWRGFWLPCNLSG